MLLGMPMPIEPDEDHATRIKCIADFIEQRHRIGAPPDPVGQPVLEQHIAQHMQMLQQQDPKKARAVAASLKQQQAQMAQQPPANITPMPPQGGQAQPQSQPAPEVDGPAQIQAKILESIKYPDAPPDIQRQLEAKAGLTSFNLWRKFTARTDARGQAPAAATSADAAGESGRAIE